MGDTKPFCDLCEMLPNGRHVFGCPADDGVPSAAPAPDTKREAFEEEVCRHLDPDRADFYLVRDEQGGRYHEWAVMLAWEAYKAAHEAGRQLGMEQARRKPLTDEAIDKALASRDSPMRIGLRSVARLIERAHGITPTPPAGDSDTP